MHYQHAFIARVRHAKAAGPGFLVSYRTLARDNAVIGRVISHETLRITRVILPTQILGDDATPVTA